MKVEKCLMVVFLASLTLSATPEAKSQGLLVDQQSVANPGGGVNLFSGRDRIGQEFTPSLNRLNAIDILGGDGHPFDGKGGQLVVHVRSGRIDGPLVGSSEVLSLPNSFFGTMKFEFPSLVPLVAGDRYVMEVVHLSVADSIAWSVSMNLFGYGPGRILADPGLDDFDLVFREGIILDRELWLMETVPEPTVLLLLVAGLTVWRAFVILLSRKPEAKLPG